MKRLFSIRIVLLIAIGITAHAAFSSDLGVVGQVYPIAETDFLVFIEQHMEEIQKNGGWQKIQNQLKERVAQHADRPAALSLPRAKTERIGYINPSISVSSDLKDATGRIILPRGTVVNPLSVISLTKELIFYDAEDPAQVRWVVDYDKKLKQTGIKDKLILVGGSISSQSKLFSRAVYFDQTGKLIKKFGIQQVPAIITQSGLSLKIREVVP